MSNFHVAVTEPETLLTPVWMYNKPKDSTETLIKLRVHFYIIRRQNIQTHQIIEPDNLHCWKYLSLKLNSYVMHQMVSEQGRAKRN